MEIPISDIKNLGNSILTALHINISHGIKIVIAIFVFLAIVVLFVAAVFVACNILKDPFLLSIKALITLIKKLYYLFLNLPWIAAIIDYKKTKKENDLLILENAKLRQEIESLDREKKQKKNRVEDLNLRDKTVTGNISNEVPVITKEQEELLRLISDHEHLTKNQLSSMVTYEKQYLELNLTRLHSLDFIVFCSSSSLNIPAWYNIQPKGQEYVKGKLSINTKTLDGKKLVLGDIWQGKWKNTFTHNGKSASEEIEIKDGDKYFRYDEHRFNIIDFDIDKDTIKFTKKWVNEENPSRPNILRKISDDRFVGEEIGFDTKVEYTRING
jgi:hypothetical protein